MYFIPVSWETCDYKSLPFVFHYGINENHKQFQNYNFFPYTKTIRLGICKIEEEFPQWIQSVVDNFNYKHINVAVHCLNPGCVLPIHQDEYYFYKNKNKISNIQQIYRTIVFLENSEPGHMIQIEQKIYNYWKFKNNSCS